MISIHWDIHLKNTLLAALAFAFAVSLAAPAPAQDAAPAAKPAKTKPAKPRRPRRKPKTGDRGPALRCERARACFQQHRRLPAHDAKLPAPRPLRPPPRRRRRLPRQRSDRAEAIKRANAFSTRLRF